MDTKLYEVFSETINSFATGKPRLMCGSNFYNGSSSNSNGLLMSGKLEQVNDNTMLMFLPSFQEYITLFNDFAAGANLPATIS